MTDDKKTKAVDQPVADEPKVDEPKVEEKAEEAAPQPAADQPASPSQGGPAPQADAPAQAGGTDQHGRQLFDVTCSSCGNKAQVPFKPSGDRPVYCRDCYMQQRNDQRGGGGGGYNRGPKRF